jgi:hypothetical protein
MLLIEAISILHGVSIHPFREMARADEFLTIEPCLIGVTLELRWCTPGTFSFTACDIESEFVRTGIEFPSH